MSKLTESQILQQVYTNIEGDATDWAATDDEYLAGRRYCNAAIDKWENATIESELSQLPIKWRELWTKNTDSSASDVTTTITAGTYTYSAPSNFVEPSSYVRVLDSNSNSTFFDVIPPEKVSLYIGSSGNWCYFTGNRMDGFTLNFNPKLTLTTGNTLGYEYYKSATTFTTTTSKTELSDDFYIVEYVTAMFYKDEDLDIYKIHIDRANAKLNQMMSKNELGYWNVDEMVGDTLGAENQSGFGY